MLFYSDRLGRDDIMAGGMELVNVWWAVGGLLCELLAYGTVGKWDSAYGLEKIQASHTQIPCVGTRTALSKSISHPDLEQQFSLATLERGPSRPIEPEKLDDGTVLVDCTDDSENPQDWSFGKKAVVLFQILIYTMGEDMGSAIYSPIEIPIIGRNPPYIISFAAFVLLTIPASLVDNFAGLIVLCFLQGFFGSPCFSVQAETWRWSMWEMLWMNAPIFLSLLLFLPETSSSTILLHLTQHLCALTGSTRLKAQSEIDQANLTPRAIATEAFVRPFSLMLLDPSIAFTAIYTAPIYAIFYSFFEAFPLVYEMMYAFNLGKRGLTFVSVTVSVMLAIAAYWSYIYYLVEPSIRGHGLGAPECRLCPALVVARTVVTTIEIFVIIQGMFLYLPLSYPQFAASLFAGNDFLSLLAGLTVVCLVGVYVLWVFGEMLRARPRFAAKWWCILGWGVWFLFSS
ncbi:hypothetical protein P280DRAFT_500393, partial [Massarina eburnea CBS 473.64]